MQQAPNISESLSKAFLQPFNIFLLHSQSLQLSLSIAKALCIQKIKNKQSPIALTTILLDANPLLIQQTNYHLTRHRQSRLINRENPHSIPSQITQLHKTTKQKRQKLYLEGGVYSISTNIMLLDLLNGTIRVGQLRRVIMFHTGQIENRLSDKYCSLVWISTLIAIQSREVPIILVSNKPKLFNKEALQTTLRLLFINKIVIWPFGRSQIQKSIKKQENSDLTKTNHKLSLHQSQQVLMLLYRKMIESCQQPNKNINKVTQVNTYDIQNLQFLQKSLLLYSKVEHLIHLMHIMQEGSSINGSIWNSNNINVIQNIQQIMKYARSFVYCIEVMHNKEQKVMIDLYDLVKSHQKFDTTEGKETEKIDVQGSLKHQELVPSNLMRDGSIQSEQQSQGIIQQSSSSNRKRIYELNYDMRVYGLEITDRDNSPVFSPKFIQLIQTVERQCFGNNLENPATKNQQIDFQHKTKIETDSIQNPSQFSKYEYPGDQRSKDQPEENIPDPNEQTIKLDKCLKQLQPQNMQPSQSIYIQTLSRDSAKNLKKQIFTYKTNTHYRAFIKLMIYFLCLKQQQRISSIKKLIKRLQNQQSKNVEKKHRKVFAQNYKNEINHKKEQEDVLLQCLFQQLMTIDEMMSHYEATNDGHNQIDQLFANELKILVDSDKVRYTNPKALKIAKSQFNVHNDCEMQLNEAQVKATFHVEYGENLSLFSRNLRILGPDICIFHHPSPILARYLSILYAEGRIPSIRQIHVFFFDNTYETQILKTTIAEEDRSFWRIGQFRQQIGQYIEDPHNRISQLYIDDEVSKKQAMLNLAISMDSQRISHNQSRRTILIDKRQFKSMLPSYLFHHGFDIIPVFLETADYIVSNSVGIQKKSVQTRDLHQSIRSGRLGQQLRRMSAKFNRPYLLIECNDISCFRGSQFSYSINKATGQKYQIHIRRELIKLLNRYPKVKVLWSTGYLHTVDMIKELKKNELQPQLNRFQPASDSTEIDDLQDDQNQSQKIREIEIERGMKGVAKKKGKTKMERIEEKLQQSGNRNQ